MLGLNPTTSTATVKPDYTVPDYIMVNLPALDDGTLVTGLIDEGRILGLDVKWRNLIIGINFVMLNDDWRSYLKPHVEIDFVDDEVFAVADWSKRRKDMIDL